MVAVIDPDAFHSIPFLSWNHACVIVGVFRRKEDSSLSAPLRQQQDHPKSTRRPLVVRETSFSSDGFGKIKRIVVLLFRRHFYSYFPRVSDRRFVPRFREFPR